MLLCQLALRVMNNVRHHTIPRLRTGSRNGRAHPALDSPCTGLLACLPSLLAHLELSPDTGHGDDLVSVGCCMTPTFIGHIPVDQIEFKHTGSDLLILAHEVTALRHR